MRNIRRRDHRNLEKRLGEMRALASTPRERSRAQSRILKRSKVVTNTPTTRAAHTHTTCNFKPNLFCRRSTPRTATVARRNRKRERMEMEKSMSDGLATVPGYYSSLVKSAGTRVFFVFRGGKEKKKKVNGIWKRSKQFWNFRASSFPLSRNGIGPCEMCR